MTTTTWSMDYFKTMQNKERTIHKKKHKFPRLTNVQYYLHNRKSKSTILRIYPIYRDWCRHCIQGKSKSQHHQRGGLTKQSITQIDNAYLRSDNDKHYARILTMCESITGLGYATAVPYKGVNTEAVKAIVRFIVENGLQSTILQSDGENAIKDLQAENARQIPNVKMQTSPQYCHQSQGVVERYHQTLLTQKFAQLRMLKFSLCQHYHLNPRNISSHNPLLNHLLHHTSWLLNRYLRHNDGKTSYERNWNRPYQQPIVAFGEKVYIEKIMPENQKLYKRNKEQKYEAIWIGRDTTTGQHITLSTEFGKQV
eukprot:353412-Amphidinium_carterae.1